MKTVKELETEAILKMGDNIKRLEQENNHLKQEVHSLQSRIHELESMVFGGNVK